MHSKVIIASLACILAATFGNTRTANVTKAQEIRAEKAACYNAPNEDGVTINFREDKIVYTEYQSYTVIFNLYYTDSICQGFQVINDPYNLFDSFFYFSNGQLGAYVNFPSGITETYVSFGKNGKEMVRMYIHTNGSYSCASGASYYDARAKYYMWQIATSSEKSYYPQYWGNNFTLNSNASVNAIKHYGDYVYGTGTSDITTTRTTTSRSGWNDYGSNLSIKVHVEWYNNGQAYPVESARVKLFSKGSQITSGVCRTNANGDYTISMSAVNTFNKTLGDLQLGIFTDTAASIVRDNYGFEYPYFYVASSSTNLFNLKKIEYKVRIYPERSDRAAAYEIAQAELVTQKYAKYYMSNDGNSITIPNNRTLFPTQRTTYLSNDYDYGNYVVSLKKAHSNNWDVVQHEYAHYICDKLGLCCSPIEGFKHRYDEDLTVRFGNKTGQQYAYSEGLATYLAIASQLDYAERVNSNSYCASIADCLYTDPINYISINYSAYEYGGTWGEYGGGVEASVTSALFKINFFLGINHSKMWAAISDSDICDISDLVNTIVKQNQEQSSQILAICESEHITIIRAKWTIMIYACGSTLEDPVVGINAGGCISHALRNIVEVQGQPDDVNIIIEAGGTTHWEYISNNLRPADRRIARYNVVNNQLCEEPNRPEYFDDAANMGESSTFESFLRWGLTYYPAKYTGVILMNHGGAMNGVCFDSSTYNVHDGFDAYNDFDSLTNAEANRALENVLGHNPTDKLEFISYEACLMAVQDIASFNSRYFNYMVASELEVDERMISGVENGCEWVRKLYGIDSDRKTLTILKSMVDKFCENGEATWEQCLSVLNLNKMSSYHAAFDNLVSHVRNRFGKSFLLENIGMHMNSCDYSPSLTNYYIVDAYRFFSDLKIRLEDRCDENDPLIGIVDCVLGYFPSEYNDIPDSSRHVKIGENASGLVVYSGSGANSHTAYGFTIHYNYSNDDLEETDFYVWRNIIMQN